MKNYDNNESLELEETLSFDDSYEKDLPVIIVNYYNQNDLICKKHFPKNVTFGEVVQDFESKFLENEKSIVDYSYNKKSINKSQKILDTIKVDRNSKITEIEVDLQVNNLDVPKVFNEQTKRIEKLLKPRSNPFRLLIYEPKEQKITVERYQKEKNIIYKLKEFSDIDSAYCDSPENLYISGGTYPEKNGKPTKNFWKINHDNYAADLIEMPIPKNNHSMIFIPNNYVFFIGGNNKETFYYDTKKNIFIKWADLNDIHIQPAIIYDENCIYIFSSNNRYYEKTNLNKNPKWERIPYKTNSKTNFNLKNFFADKTTDGKIIFYGGEKIKGSNQYMFDPKTKEVNKLENIEKEDRKSGEKSVYK